MYVLTLVNAQAQVVGYYSADDAEVVPLAQARRMEEAEAHFTKSRAEEDWELHPGEQWEVRHTTSA
jgi:hypothetical protein